MNSHPKAFAPPALSLAAALVWLRWTGRIVGGLALIGALFVIVSHGRDFDAEGVCRLIGAYPYAPMAYLALHVVASLLFLPRTVMGVGAVLLFGAAWGFAWALAGAVIGGIACFAVARGLNDGTLDLEDFGPTSWAAAQLNRGGWLSVTLLRVVPGIPHSLTNYALGLTRVTVPAFLIGSLLGQIPSTLFYVYVATAGLSSVSAAWHILF